MLSSHFNRSLRHNLGALTFLYSTRLALFRCLRVAVLLHTAMDPFHGFHGKCTFASRPKSTHSFLFGCSERDANTLPHFSTRSMVWNVSVECVVNLYLRSAATGERDERGNKPSTTQKLLFLFTRKSFFLFVSVCCFAATVAADSISPDDADKFTSIVTNVNVFQFYFRHAFVGMEKIVVLFEMMLW